MPLQLAAGLKKAMFTKPLPEPWLGFLKDLDQRLPEPMTLLCMGAL